MKEGAESQKPARKKKLSPVSNWNLEKAHLMQTHNWGCVGCKEPRRANKAASVYTDRRGSLKGWRKGEGGGGSCRSVVSGFRPFCDSNRKGRQKRNLYSLKEGHGYRGQGSNYWRREKTEVFLAITLDKELARGTKSIKKIRKGGGGG